ncbi:MAG: NADH-quinone oxidoreductase subunit M [Planctomycetaceae bacterium]
MPDFFIKLLDNVVFLMVLLPLVGAALVVASARMGEEAIRRTALVNVLFSCALAIGMVAHFSSGAADSVEVLVDEDDHLVAPRETRDAGGPRLATPMRWLAASDGKRVVGPDVRLSFGVDGLSLWLIAMVPFVMLAALCAAQDTAGERPAVFHALLLGAQAGAIAAFAARDVVLFVVALETTLLCTFLLLGNWGGYDRRTVARKFLAYNLAGGLLVIVGLIGLVIVEQRMRGGAVASTAFATPATFAYERLVDPLPSASPETNTLPGPLELAGSSTARGEQWAAAAPWIFAALLIGFAIRAGTFPFHTWLTSANLEATASTSVFLTAVQINLGLYGLLRFVVPLFPDMCLIAADGLVGLGVFGAAYGGLLAIAQGDLKKLATYVCVAHIGICLAGIFSLTQTGLSGAVLLLVTHGLGIALFLSLIGLLERRYRTRDMEPFGGLAARRPRLAGALAFAALTLAGAPGLGTFLGETLAVMGVYRGFAPGGTHLPRTALALVATLLVAWALFGMIGRILRGRFREPGSGMIYASQSGTSPLPFRDGMRGASPDDGDSVVAIPLPPRAPAAPRDASWSDLCPLLPMAAAVIWLGTMPQFFLDETGPAVDRALAGYPRLRLPPAAAPAIEPPERGGSDGFSIRGESRFAAPRSTEFGSKLGDDGEFALEGPP